MESIADKYEALLMFKEKLIPNQCEKLNCKNFSKLGLLPFCSLGIQMYDYNFAETGKECLYREEMEELILVETLKRNINI